MRKMKAVHSKKPSKAALKRCSYPRQKQIMYFEDCIEQLNKANTVEELEKLKTGYFVEHIEEIAQTTYKDNRGFDYDWVKDWCICLLSDCRERADAKIERIKGNEV